MIKCRNCNRENDDSFTFCLDCGAELKPSPQADSPADVSETPAIPVPSAARPASPAAPASVTRAPAAAAPAPAAAAPVPAAAAPARATAAPAPAAAAPARATAAPVPAAAAPARATAAPVPAAASASVAAPAAANNPCAKCGHPVKTGDAFCSACGHRVGQPVAAPAASPSAQEAPAHKGSTMFMHVAAPEQAVLPRARLVLIKPDGTEGTVFTLAEKTTIGRTQGVIMFPKDPFISPRHAEIAFTAGKLTITDSSSLNGIFRKLTDPVRIVPGTYFRIGRQLLRLEVPGDFQPLSTSTPAGDDSKFWGSPTPQVWARLIQVLEGGKIGEIHLLTQAEVIIGREDGEIRFPEDGFISSRHCKLVNRDGNCYLEDMGSSNGTYVRIQKSHDLETNDLVQIGNQVLRVDIV